MGTTASVKSTTETSTSVRDQQVRYLPHELEEFKNKIHVKLKKARKLCKELEQEVRETGSSTDRKSQLSEDGGELSMMEDLNQRWRTQLKFQNKLEFALLRIKNGTYGICNCKRGPHLIDPARLNAQLVATTCVDAKAGK